MIIYQITLPKRQNAGAFVKFMQEEYFPAIHKGPTRVGQVTGLILLELEKIVEKDNAKNEFFLHVGWSGLSVNKVRVDDPEIEQKFAAFDAKIKHLGYYEEVANWNGESSA